MTDARRFARQMERDNTDPRKDKDDAAFDRMVERKRNESTRDKIDAERARRWAVGDAFTSVLLGTQIQDVVGQSKGSVGDRFIRRLRELGYDVVKIEGGE